MVCSGGLLCMGRRVHVYLCDCVDMRIVLYILTGSGRSRINPTITVRATSSNEMISEIYDAF